MQFVTASDLRRPSVWSKLSRDTSLVTRRGRPIALILPVDESSFEEVLNEVRRLEALRAMRKIQRHARAAPAHTMTPGEIQAEIVAARKARRARRP
jgi:antitoxin (DNA-binding transcriptional repressor) of toxin-antitoxin stability system